MPSDADLDRVCAGAVPHSPVVRRAGPPRRSAPPEDPFHGSSRANLADQTVTRYATCDDAARLLPALRRPDRPARPRRRSGGADPGGARRVRPGLHRPAAARAPPGRRRGPGTRPRLPAGRRPARPPGCARPTSTSPPPAPRCAASSLAECAAAREPARQRARRCSAGCTAAARLAVAGYVAGGARGRGRRGPHRGRRARPDRPARRRDVARHLTRLGLRRHRAPSSVTTPRGGPRP